MEKIMIRKQDQNIYDIAPEQDLEVNFPENSAFAVIKTAFFGGGYTTHRHEYTAIRKCKELDRMGIQYEIIDDDGYFLDIHPNIGLYRRD